MPWSDSTTDSFHPAAGRQSRPIWGAFAVASTSKRVGPGVKVVAGKERAKRLEELYYEWMRREWLEEEDPRRLQRYLASPAMALRELAGPFKKLEAEFELNFWASRFGR